MSDATVQKADLSTERPIYDCMKIGYGVSHGRHFVLVVGNLKPSDAIEIVGPLVLLQKYGFTDFQRVLVGEG